MDAPGVSSSLLVSLSLYTALLVNYPIIIIYYYYYYLCWNFPRTQGCIWPSSASSPPHVAHWPLLSPPFVSPSSCCCVSRHLSGLVVLTPNLLLKSVYRFFLRTEGPDNTQSSKFSWQIGFILTATPSLILNIIHLLFVKHTLKTFPVFSMSFDHIPDTFHRPWVGTCLRSHIDTCHGGHVSEERMSTRGPGLSQCV